MTNLYAFFADTPVGAFRRTADGIVTFHYQHGYEGTPLSLSLPIDGPPTTQHAAATFLDNLLPDDPRVRRRWQAERGLADHSPFTLLGSYGHDVSGALTLSPEQDLPIREPEAVIEATADDVAARIATLRHESTSWLDPRVRPRMSLGGAQGKFSLAKVGDQWFWPTFRLPSTHILKPPSARVRNLERFENAALRLARKIGLRASDARVGTFHNQSTFIVRRWDRVNGTRLHAEDLNQALGSPTSAKYDVAAPAVARLLAAHGQEWDFIRQLAFNAALGNADAHAKNYSVLLSGSDVRLAPLYDAIPTYFYPFDKRLAMPIGAARLPAELTAANWQRFAADSRLDSDQVCEEAFTVIARVAEHYEAIFDEAGIDAARRRLLQRHVAMLRRVLPRTY